MFTVKTSETSAGIRIYGIAGWTYILRRTAGPPYTSRVTNGFFRVATATQTGTFVDLVGTLASNDITIEAQDPSGAIMEYFATTYSTNLTLQHAYDVVAPLSGQVYITGDSIEVKVIGTSSDTVTCDSAALTYLGGVWSGVANITPNSNDYSATIIVTKNGVATTKTVYRWPVAESNRAIVAMTSWLHRFMDVIQGTPLVRERYMPKYHSWNFPGLPISYRTDCNLQTAITFFQVSKITNNPYWSDKADAIWTEVRTWQQEDGTWPFMQFDNGTWAYSPWMDDISFYTLFKLAEADPPNATDYIAKGLKTTDWVISQQDVNTGMFPLVGTVYDDEGPISGNPVQYPLVANLCVASLCIAYPHTPNKTTYRLAIEKWLNKAVIGITTPGGYNYSRLYFTASFIKTLALAEKHVTDSAYISSWRSTRLDRIEFLKSTYIHTNFGIKNDRFGTSPDVPAFNTPDEIYCSDYIYNNKLVMEGLLFSAQLDGDSALLEYLGNILEFTKSIMMRSDIPDMNECLFGGYNLKDGNYDTVTYQWVGGGDIYDESSTSNIYTGWSAAPIASVIYDFNNTALSPGQVRLKPGPTRLKKGTTRLLRSGLDSGLLMAMTSDTPMGRRAVMGYIACCLAAHMLPGGEK